MKQVYSSAWSINDTYILKRNTNASELEKSVSLSNMLVSDNIPVPKYFQTINKDSYVYFDGEYNYCLMSKFSGHHIYPFLGDCAQIGKKLGKIVANLHKSLKKIGKYFDYYDADIIKELDGWIVHEVREKNLEISQEIIDKCYEFERLYSKLPRQLIHRDMHLGNLIFDNDNFIGYLDFDISQYNVRIFDICYLGAGLLVENYQDANRLSLWQDIFRGILEGYEEISLLSSDEKQAIPMMFLMIELLFTAYYSKIGQAETSRSCIHMTNWLYNNIDKIQSITYK
ncbi:MAG: hypothetical protein EWM50_07870 [Gottschalkiaceae bacterium]|nr:MAG: hypothetical protein EWM50_07870 [Gottschalkiaceae bacterium]